MKKLVLPSNMFEKRDELLSPAWFMLRVATLSARDFLRSDPDGDELEVFVGLAVRCGNNFFRSNTDGIGFEIPITKEHVKAVGTQNPSMYAVLQRAVDDELRATFGDGALDATGIVPVGVMAAEEFASVFFLVNASNMPPSILSERHEWMGQNQFARDAHELFAHGKKALERILCIENREFTRLSPDLFSLGVIDAETATVSAELAGDGRIIIDVAESSSHFRRVYESLVADGA